MTFRVTHIIDGSTIEVDGWKWEGKYEGSIVKIVGYHIQPGDAAYNELAKHRLTILVLDKNVELIAPQKAERGKNEKSDILYCSVLLNNVDISEYFPDRNFHKLPRL